VLDGFGQQVVLGDETRVETVMRESGATSSRFGLRADWTLPARPSRRDGRRVARVRVNRCHGGRGPFGLGNRRMVARVTRAVRRWRIMRVTT